MVCFTLPFQSKFLDDLTHQAGFLTNGTTPKDSNIVPSHVKPTPLEITIKEKIKL